MFAENSTLREEYLTGWTDPTGWELYCLKLRQGHCGGCHVLPKVGTLFRWQRRKPEKAAQIAAQQHCPPGLMPDVGLVVNKDASYAMGQPNGENTDFIGVTPNPKGRKLHGKY